MKYNAVAFINDYSDDEICFSVVTPDQKEHVVIIDKKEFKTENYWIPVEYEVRPSCCEHPDGCPGGSKTENFLRKVNNE